jgi:hypothetical protein
MSVSAFVSRLAVAATLVFGAALGSHGLMGCTLPGTGAGATGQGVVINGSVPDPKELGRLESALGISVPAGEYWHDRRSGLAGPKGGYARTFAPGFDFGEVAVDASGGNTRIYYNGRELSLDEARVVAFLYDIPESMIPQFQGRYVLESTGDLYRESDGTYLGNLMALAQAKAKTTSGSSADGFSCSGTSSNGPTCSGSSGGCTSVTIPSSTPSSTGVPNRIDVAAGPGC